MSQKLTPDKPTRRSFSNLDKMMRGVNDRKQDNVEQVQNRTIGLPRWKQEYFQSINFDERHQLSSGPGMSLVSISFAKGCSSLCLSLCASVIAFFAALVCQNANFAFPIFNFLFEPTRYHTRHKSSKKRKALDLISGCLTEKSSSAWFYPDFQ